MIKKIVKNIIRDIENRRKIKILKTCIINQLLSFIVKKDDYILGFQKLLLASAKSDNIEELQKMLDEFIDIVNKTKVVNDAIKETETKKS